jgi:hypothetical protein
MGLLTDSDLLLWAEIGIGHGFEETLLEGKSFSKAKKPG